MSPARSSLSSSKKRKTTQDDTVAQINSLESDLTAAVSAKASLNPLADLLDLALASHEAAHLCKAIYALYRVFTLLISNGMLAAHGASTEDDKAVHTWITQRLHDFVELLAGLLQDEEAILRTSALQILFSLQKHLSSALLRFSPAGPSAQPQFHVSHFRKIVSALLRCPPSSRSIPVAKKQKMQADPGSSTFGKLETDVQRLFVDKWFTVYDDVRWFFLREAGSILANLPQTGIDYVPENLLAILEGLTTFPTNTHELNAWWVEELGKRPDKWTALEDDDAGGDVGDDSAKGDQDDWRKFFEQESTPTETTNAKQPSLRIHKLTIHQSLHSLTSHRAIFTRTWLLLLPHLSLRSDSKANALRVLNIMHRGILPHLTRPILVMDWVGGTVGLLALNALFALIKEYNLDYPSFYTRLYAFLDRDVFNVKHRARFFRLMELFLSSTHLPVALVAAFVKRLSRLSLNAPPAAIVMTIPLTYNLLKKHPALMCMIHNAGEADDLNNDPFRMEEPVPAATNALESSLWELYSHKQHYHSVVATLAGIFEEAFTRPAYAMEDFLDHTYATVSVQ
ncbi:CBF-domain-containing protein [Wolfiporia cocos MD-104 SS10]|uniref:CBF-domain-containing protein n=1 Tax=Wolfiporia cocos (strain MD-104) TaxID=742152 RepID=A0A2H3JB37_WOLCO|nr:CBF-domain-containing protein [Wolfiporia cocos MD-104 SS10]